MSIRNLSPYELNQLQKHQIIPEKLNWDDLGSKPVEYITGFCEFYGRDFIVNENVLIPRVETEKIIDLALERIPNNNKRKILFADIGTGSGAIGLTFALELQKRNIEFNAYLSDISDQAIEVTKENLKILSKGDLRFANERNRQSKIEIRKSNLFENYNPKLKFDVIFANLPYIPTNRISELDSSVKDFEPHLALDGGRDGLTIIRKFLEQAKDLIRKYGVVILEVDDSHTKEIFNEENLNLSNWNYKFVNDVNSKNRFIILTKH